MHAPAPLSRAEQKESINKEELGSFPLSLGSIEINYKDSSVTGTVLGMATKAIYRSGLGCTLVNDLSENVIRSQNFEIPVVNNVPDSFWSSVTADSLLINKTKLNEATSITFQEEFNKKPVLTKALVVVYKNKIIAENMLQATTTILCFWVGRWPESVTGALIGILAKQGKLNPVQPAPVSEWQKAKTTTGRKSQ